MNRLDQQIFEQMRKDAQENKPPEPVRLIRSQHFYNLPDSLKSLKDEEKKEEKK